jgi:5-deoxy-glucuronate isomerase
MPRLLRKPYGARGRVQHVTPENAGWSYVGFDVYRLAGGESASCPPGERETCLVFVSGKGKVTAGGEALGEIGGRASPFEGRPHSVYLPAGCGWRVEAAGDCELAVCSAPGRRGSHPVRVIGPEQVTQEVRGKGSNTRYVTNILPETEPADSLLVVEVITPAGNTSSYPPHKHDQNDLPRESYLEETYYHRLNPPQGFAFQRVYTDDRSLDEAMAVENGDVVLVPKGYHPTATCHGYDLYYLNVMAGPVRTWKFRNAKEHEWLLKA